MKIRGYHISFKLVGFWVVMVALADLLAGHFLLPVITREGAGLGIKEYLRLSCLHPYYNHGFNPNSEGPRQFGPIKYNLYINSLGMTDTRVRKVTMDGRKKVLFIGDSFTEGVGFPYVKTFVGIINSRIDTTRIDILNASVASFSPKLYFLRIKYLIEHEEITPSDVYCCIDYSDYGDELVYEDFKPSLSFAKDKAISFFRLNSVAYNCYHALCKLLFFRKSGIPANSGESFVYWVKTGNDFLNRYPDFYMIRQDWLREIYYNRSNATLTKGIQLANSNMDSLNALCKHYGVKLHVVVYPHDSFLTLKPELSHYPETLWRKYCTERGVDFISLYNIFITADSVQNRNNADNYFLKGDSHWNEAGHKLVATELLKYINQ